MIATLPVLGAGLGFREPYRADVLLDGEGVDFLEVIADHYLDAPPEKLRELDLLAERYPLIPHGLNLSLGSAEGLDPVYRDQLAGAWSAGSTPLVERACRVHPRGGRRDRPPRPRAVRQRRASTCWRRTSPRSRNASRPR